MPQLDLGRVKGDPFLYEDLTEEQKLELKGEKGDMPIVKAGTTTIVEYEQGAKVTSETNGDVTSFNFQIPIGQKPPFYGAYADFPEVGDSNRTYIDDTVDPRLMYTWDDTTQAYVLTGGAGGADSGSVDIPITLTSADWTGTTAPYQQTVTLPQMREGMTPLYFLASDGDDAQYAFGLIIDYQVGYAEITFYAADRPAVDLNLTLKGIPAQEMEYVDNTVVFLVEPSAFALNSTTQRYEATIPVEGMTAGTGGTWDIVRSGPVLTEVESNIALHITDVDRLDGAVKISCLEVPEQRYMMSISGAYPDAEPGTVILAGMQEWFDRVDALDKTEMGTMIEGEHYDSIVKAGTQIFYKYIIKAGKIVIFSFVFTANDISANTPLTLFTVPYRPMESMETDVIISGGQVVTLFCGKNGEIVLRPNQNIPEGSIVRLRAIWITN